MNAVFILFNYKRHMNLTKYESQRITVNSLCSQFTAPTERAVAMTNAFSVSFAAVLEQKSVSEVFPAQRTNDNHQYVSIKLARAKNKHDRQGLSFEIDRLPFHYKYLCKFLLHRIDYAN